MDDSTVELLEKLKTGQTFLRADLDAVIHTLSDISEEGFTDRELLIITKTITTSRNLLDSQRFSKLLSMLTPKTILPEEVFECMVVWLHDNYKEAPLPHLKAVCFWMTGIFEYDLLDKEVINQYYEIFFDILHSERIQRHISELFYNLTEPHDVSRWRVKQIFKLYENQNNARHLAAILTQFKAFRPENVPEPIPAMNISNAFPKLPKEFIYHMQKANERMLSTKASETVKSLKIIQNETQRTKKKTDKLIPDLKYIPATQNTELEAPKQTLQCYRSITELAQNFHRLHLPCHAMSLLATQAGMLVLTFGESHLHNRFLYYLSSTLQEVFIKDRTNVTENEKDDLLLLILAYENYIRQGLPCVTHFLSEYMRIWDGDSHFDALMGLFTWVTFSSYTELYQKLLRYLSFIFIAAFPNEKIKIIKMLEELIRNLFNNTVWRMLNNIPYIFPIPDKWPIAETLSEICRYASGLCAQAMRDDPTNVMIRHASLDLHETITELEYQSKLPLLTVAPLALTYTCLLSVHADDISRFCALLLRYKLLKERLNTDRENEEKIMTVNHYTDDYLDFLWNGNVLKPTNTLLFSRIKGTLLNKFIRKIPTFDDSFILRNHIAFQPYIHSTAKHTVVTDRVVMRIVQNCAKPIINFLKTFNTQ